ncbi:hypothetical protein Tco_0847422 [Tanacetum coccineum]
MRTRNSYFPNNSNVTIPRRRNKGRAPNIVEPELRTIVAPMAERTMEELLRAPTEGYGEAIILPEINADHFEIKTNLLQLVQAKNSQIGNMWPKGTGPTLSGNAAGASTTADASNTVDASDDVLHSGQCVSLGHWLLDSSETSCVPGNGCHLASGSWTHPERLAFRVMGVTWPVALGLIRNEPVYGDEEADIQRAVELSIKEQSKCTQGPARPVFIREPDSDRFLMYRERENRRPAMNKRTPTTTEPSGHAESPSLYEELGLTDSDTESDEEASPETLSFCEHAGPNVTTSHGGHTSTRMIWRFTVADDLKECSKITQVKGTMLNDYYNMYKEINA